MDELELKENILSKQTIKGMECWSNGLQSIELTNHYSISPLLHYFYPSIKELI
jgi:hypothetical protein